MKRIKVHTNYYSVQKFTTWIQGHSHAATNERLEISLALFAFQLHCIENLLLAFSLNLPSIVFNPEFWDKNQQLQPSLSDHQIWISHAQPSTAPTLTLQNWMDFVTWTKYVGQFEYSALVYWLLFFQNRSHPKEDSQQEYMNKCERWAKSTMHDIDDHMQFRCQHVKLNLQNIQNHRTSNLSSQHPNKNETLEFLFDRFNSACQKDALFNHYRHLNACHNDLFIERSLPFINYLIDEYWFQEDPKLLFWSIVQTMRWAH